MKCLTSSGPLFIDGSRPIVVEIPSPHRAISFGPLLFAYLNETAGQQDDVDDFRLCDRVSNMVNSIFCEQILRDEVPRSDFRKQ